MYIGGRAIQSRAAAVEIGARQKRLTNHCGKECGGKIGRKNKDTLNNYVKNTLLMIVIIIAIIMYKIYTPYLNACIGIWNTPPTSQHNSVSVYT